MDGVIIINKSKGYTSHDIVNILRKETNIKKIGHTGTLDPNATGVLPVLIGKATKISKYLMEHDKIYIATIRLGQKTDTGDAEGRIILEKQPTKLDEKIIVQALEDFAGEQMQCPPMYSAVKIKGKKLYEYARNGEEVSIKPRKIKIYDIKFLEYNNEKIKIRVHCSKGTYIRVLCEQIAEKLNTVGYMETLERIKVNDFDINESITIEEIKNDNTLIQKKILPIECIFKNNESIIIKDIKKFLNGVKLYYELQDGVYRVYYNDEFLGLGVIKNNLLKRDVII